MDNLVLDGGFADLVKDSQSVFRTVMDALSRPGLKQPIHVDAAPPAPLSPEVAAIALTLADHDSPVWLDETLAASEAVVAWLKFHTGAPIVSDPRQADFALVTGWAKLPKLDAFGIGTDEYPDRSTTVILAVQGFNTHRTSPGEDPGPTGVSTRVEGGNRPRLEAGEDRGGGSLGEGEVTRALTITGPGIKDTGTLTIAGITGDFIAQWALNRELFPCGVDVVFAGAGHVVGLPRTTRIVEA
ncbi:hypothetical protein JP74_06990 [Devosia sp. 17-2-E-8]|nr:hypothetical protein JP74_06990 [Devosia sp. 17-2-E-8]